MEGWRKGLWMFDVPHFAFAAVLFSALTAFAQPLRYTPERTDFVITNGPEFFNRPLYCDHSAFRVDAGDKPEFSIYLPGRGGNLRLGIKTGAGLKWLNDADKIVARYRPGAMVYEIQDSLLNDGELRLEILPLNAEKGFIVRAELASLPEPAQLIWAFGGANGMKGQRGGDIGCEREPVSQFFQLRPEQCRDNKFSIATNKFVLRGKTARLQGIVSAGAKMAVADASEWNVPAKLFAAAFSLTPGLSPAARRPTSPAVSTAAAAGMKTVETVFPSNTIRTTRLKPGVNEIELPLVAGQADFVAGQPIYLVLRQVADGQPAENEADLGKNFSAAETHRREIAERVVVETPDPFINAAAGALNVAADAIWDEQQKSFMHGAVAWRQRLLGWRGPYSGDALGWHERTAEHFAGFARQQNVDPIPATLPAPEESANLSRNETALHSKGDLTHSHYDMNLLAVDAFFRHLLWTGDLNYANEMWPVIERHFAWERRLFRREFGPGKLPLYEGYACIWASDDLSYNGGGAAHASALNFYANKMAARVVKLIGKDPAPYEREADLISRAMQTYLWMPDAGTFAESRDFLGLQLPHANAALWTFYHTLDSEIPTPLEAWQMSRWVDDNLAHIPIEIPNDEFRMTNGEAKSFILPTTRWMPYQWSLNNVVVAESAHASLGYWQADRPETACALFKGTLLDTMFCGLCPGNIGCMTHHDMARGEAQRDFGDGIGAVSRALVEGLFGVKPDALAGELTIVPGFPADWRFAKIHHPDFNFEFHREDVSEDFTVESKFSKPMKLILQIPAFSDWIGSTTVNGSQAKCKFVEGIFGVPRLEITADPAPKWAVRVEWRGDRQAEKIPPEIQPPAASKVEPFDWDKNLAGEKFETVNLAPIFNDRVTEIFRNEYRSPRSPFCSLALPKQGIGSWCHPQQSVDVDDSGLRSLAEKSGGKILLPDGIPLATPGAADAKNVAFVSQWDSYPREIFVPLAGTSSHAFLLMAGSTSAMQSRCDNGEVIVSYADGSTARLALRNPTTWWPIDQDYFIDDFAFARPEPLPVRVDLRTGKIRVLKMEEFKGQGRIVPGGAATVLDVPLDANKELKSLTVRAIANEVVIGLMSLTLQR